MLIYQKAAKILAILLLLLWAAVPVLAQHQHGGADCSSALLDRTVKSVSELSRLAQDFVVAENLDDALVMLDSMQRQIATTQALCYELVFRSENEGFQAVIGPVQFIDGVYRARMTTNGDITVKITALDGDCESDQMLFDLAAGYAIVPDGAETVFSPRSCSGLIEVSASEPWLLAFEAVSGGMHEHDEEAIEIGTATPEANSSATTTDQSAWLERVTS